MRKFQIFRSRHTLDGINPKNIRFGFFSQIEHVFSAQDVKRWLIYLLSRYFGHSEPFEPFAPICDQSGQSPLRTNAPSADQGKVITWVTGKTQWDSGYMDLNRTWSNIEHKMNTAFGSEH